MSLKCMGRSKRGQENAGKVSCSSGRLSAPAPQRVNWCGACVDLRQRSSTKIARCPVSALFDSPPCRPYRPRLNGSIGAGDPPSIMPSKGGFREPRPPAAGGFAVTSASTSCRAAGAGNSQYPASRELHKIYRVVPDEEAAQGEEVRVVAERGEDYVYPAEGFVPVRLPGKVQAALLRSADGSVAANKALERARGGYGHCPFRGPGCALSLRRLSQRRWPSTICRQRGETAVGSSERGASGKGGPFRRETAR